jgi:hypothetical protein
MQSCKKKSGDSQGLDDYDGERTMLIKLLKCHGIFVAASRERVVV